MMIKKLIIYSISFSTLLLWPHLAVKAMPVGTILYRTSGENMMYGYNTKDLLVAEKGILKHIYSGHAGIYVGQEKGVDYVVEMQANGAIKIPAQEFVNEDLGEKLIGAKLPRNATPLQIAKAVSIAKNLAAQNLAYDFDFKKQKGPDDKEWTCVGLTEKVYESADISNPNNLKALEYNPAYYAVNITPDGYDSLSTVNTNGDCVAEDLEFSKISAQKKMFLPAPELFGFDVGLEYRGDRYFFLPYTQYLQNSLEDVPVDIKVSSSFSASDVRGDANIFALVLKWSLINNPLSSLKKVATKIGDTLLVLKGETNSAADLLSNSSMVKTSSTPVVVASSSKVSATKNVAIKASSTVSQLSLVPSKTVVSSVKSGVSTSSTTTVVSGAQSPVLGAVSQSGTSSLLVNTLTATSSTATKVSLITPSTQSVSKVAVAPIVSTVVAASKVATASTSSTVNIASAQPIATVPATSNPITTTTIIINTNINPVVNASTPATQNNNDVIEEVASPEPMALIAKVYSNGSDDWLEIINASDFDFDLAEANYRLEKAKTAADPTLILRFGDESDGVFPGGTIIKAHGYYLVASVNASEEIISQAQAIVTKDSFSWTEEAYTIYLARGPVSSDNDIDIVDKLGFGEAKYFETAPATYLKPGYALERKANATSTVALMTTGGLEEFWPRLFDSNDNSQDFILTVYDQSLIDQELAAQNTDTDNVDIDDQDSDLEANKANDDGLFVNPVGLESEGLTQLWHFDECDGNIAYNELTEAGLPAVDLNKSQAEIGLWGCALRLRNDATSTKAQFNSILDPNQLTINFYYRIPEDNGGFFLNLYNDEQSGRRASIWFNPYFTEVSGFPGPEGRIGPSWLLDHDWHQASVVFNRVGNYWAIYLDAQEVYRYNYEGIMPTFKYLELKGSDGMMTILDELSFWSRSLPPSELELINSVKQPFNPYSWPKPQKKATLMHYWNFDENAGTSTQDIVTGQKFKISLDRWNMEGMINSAVTIDSFAGSNFEYIFDPIPADDLAISFWSRNNSFPEESRFNISLENSSSSILFFKPTIYNVAAGFNNWGDYIFYNQAGIVPSDSLWHNFVLRYNSYRFVLELYVDGKKKYSQPVMKATAGTIFNRLKVVNENWPSILDEVRIYSGLLSEKQITEDYEALR